MFITILIVISVIVAAVGLVATAILDGEPSVYNYQGSTNNGWTNDEWHDHMNEMATYDHDLRGWNTIQPSVNSWR